MGSAVIGMCDFEKFIMCQYNCFPQLNCEIYFIAIDFSPNDRPSTVFCGICIYFTKIMSERESQF